MLRFLVGSDRQLRAAFTREWARLSCEGKPCVIVDTLLACKADGILRAGGNPAGLDALQMCRPFTAYQLVRALDELLRGHGFSEHAGRLAPRQAASPSREGRQGGPVPYGERTNAKLLACQKPLRGFCACLFAPGMGAGEKPRTPSVSEVFAGAPIHITSLSALLDDVEGLERGRLWRRLLEQARALGSLAEVTAGVGGEFKALVMPPLHAAGKGGSPVSRAASPSNAGNSEARIGGLI